jgi:Bacterial Ig domain
MSRTTLVKFPPLPRLLLPVVLFATTAVGAVVFMEANAASRRCVPAQPQVSIQNTYGWSQFGSWAAPGETYPYDVVVYNQDVNCRAARFNLASTLPSGFTMDMPTTSLSIKSSSFALLHLHVTSPATTADGDYAFQEKVWRDLDPSSEGFGNSIYKVYSKDTQPPVFGWWSPADGQTVADNPAFTVSLSDEHRVRRLELYIDGVPIYAKDYDPIVQYNMSFQYTWPTKGVARGLHTMRAVGYDGSGNRADWTTSFNLQ